MFAYRVSVKRDGDIHELPLVMTKEPSMDEALDVCKGYGRAMDGEIVSVAPVTLKDAEGVVDQVTGEFFDIKELASACAQMLGSVSRPGEEQIMSVIQLTAILKEKTQRAMELVDVLDKVTFPLTVPEVANE